MRLRPSLMRRAVRNLIENAVKYGDGAEVRIDHAPGSVAIVVADRGPGIPADRLADVFDAFTRLETSRNRETGGIGLGLALARAIVAMPAATSGWKTAPKAASTRSSPCRAEPDQVRPNARLATWVIRQARSASPLATT